MSESSPEEPRGEIKFFGKHNWRGKLFSADSRLGEVVDILETTHDDIDTFLNRAGTTPEAGPQSAPLAPRIDVAAGSRPTSAASVDREDTIIDVYRRPKPRQNKGLRVRFVLSSTVIGVGGDEAELPSRDVSRSFADLVRSERSSSKERSQEHGRSTDPYEEASFRPSSLQRRPTGADDQLIAEEPRHAGHDREAFQSAYPGIRKVSTQARNGEQDVDPLNERDVRVLTCGPPPTSKDLSNDQSYTWQTRETGDYGVTRRLVAPREALLANPLTPNESPEPPRMSQEYFPRPTKDLSKLPDSGHQGIDQNFQDVSHNPKSKPLPLPTASNSPGNESLDDFDSRVGRFSDLFRLNASARVDIMAVPFDRWVRISAWWFLRGRGGLEDAMRGKSSPIAPANVANEDKLSSILKQGYVDLAKAWWVLKDVTPNHPEMKKLGNASISSMVAVKRSLRDQPLAELVGVHLGVLRNMRNLAMSMKRNGRLPPYDLQMQRLEPQIFLETPTLSPDIAVLMVNSSTKAENSVADPFFPVLVGDTERHFCFGQMFVDVFLGSRDDTTSGIHIPCVVSVLRERTDWTVKAAVASQDGQVSLVIGEHGGLHWHDVQWKIPLHTMQLGLAEGVCLQIRFIEKDFKTIWGICDYTQRIRKDYSARSGEGVLFERVLQRFQCFDCPSFPAEPIKDCRVRLFERKLVAIESSDQNRAHDGYRLVVITPPGTKKLSKVNHQLGKDNPILFGTHRSKSGNTLLVRVPSSLRVSLTFHEASDVEQFHSTLAGTSIAEADHCSASLQLQNLTISPVSAGQDTASMTASPCVSNLKWHKLRVVNRGPPTYGHDSQSTARSEHLRLLADCDSGTFTDRINAGPGELQINLSVDNLNEIKLLRAAQQDMTWAFTDGVLQEADLSSLSHMLHSIGASPSVGTYHFRSPSDLHSFQAMLTGFHVLYDGLASTFSISRRRMVGMNKRWEASTPRLQIGKQEKAVQLVAFFKDFSHGACMNFVLKVTDLFDTFTRSGVFFLRIVDAKFALPKGESDPARDFVCLDLPEYPGEHDDIVIGFDSVQDRDRFAQTLPAPVTKMSRMASLRR